MKLIFRIFKIIYVYRIYSHLLSESFQDKYYKSHVVCHVQIIFKIILVRFKTNIHTKRENRIKLNDYLLKDNFRKMKAKS